MKLTAKEREARADLIRKVRGMLRDCDKQIPALIDKLQAAGADVFGEHADRIEPGTGNYVIPKCVLVAMLEEWAGPRGYGPSKRAHLQSSQDREWKRRINQYGILL